MCPPPGSLSLFFLSGLFAPSSLQFTILSFTLLLHTLIHLSFYSALNSPSHIFCFLFVFFNLSVQSVLLLPSVCFIPNKLDWGLSLRTVLVCHHLCAYLYFSLGGAQPNQSVFRCYLSFFCPSNASQGVVAQFVPTQLLHVGFVSIKTKVGPPVHISFHPTTKTIQQECVCVGQSNKNKGVCTNVVLW